MTWPVASSWVIDTTWYFLWESTVIGVDNQSTPMYSFIRQALGLDKLHFHPASATHWCTRGRFYTCQPHEKTPIGHYCWGLIITKSRLFCPKCIRCFLRFYAADALQVFLSPREAACLIGKTTKAVFSAAGSTILHAETCFRPFLVTINQG